MSKQDSLFRGVYQAMSDAGHCDAPGGSEYRRVLRAWRNAGVEETIAIFIRYHANQSSETTTFDDTLAVLRTISGLRKLAADLLLTRTDTSSDTK